MNRILILFAHPALHKSRVHKHLIHAVDGLEGVTFNDLYETYPTMHINVRHEQKLLTEHEIVIFQHPFYWYSTPCILKEWQDLVLQYGFAYGKNGSALQGKKFLNVMSTGGFEENYQTDGAQRFTIRQLLAPIEQTAFLCGMDFLPPFVVHGTHQLSPEEIANHRDDYRRVLIALRDGTIDLDAARNFPRLNSELGAVLPPSAIPH